MNDNEIPPEVDKPLKQLILTIEINIKPNEEAESGEWDISLPDSEDDNINRDAEILEPTFSLENY